MKQIRKIYIIFLWAVLILLLIVTYLSIRNFSLEEIPAIAGFIGWIVVVFLKIFTGLKEKLYITLKGMVASTRVQISIRITDIDDFDEFLRKFQKRLEENEYVKIEKFPINRVPESVNVQTTYKKSVSSLTPKTRKVNFNISTNIDINEYEQDLYIRFEPIQSKHRDVVSFSEDVNEYVRVIDKVIDHDINRVYFDLDVSYPDSNNPLISAFVMKKEIDLTARGKNYIINNDQINVNSKAENLVEFTKKTMSGSLDY